MQVRRLQFIFLVVIMLFTLPLLVLADCTRGYFYQPSFPGDCLNRPPHSVCIGYPDGYVWLIYDAIEGWRDQTCETNQVTVAIGFIGEYHHILHTNSVKFIPSPEPITLTLSLTGCTSCRSGDRFTVEAHVTNSSSHDVMIEAKVGVRLPDGVPVNLNLLGNKHMEVRISAGFDTTFTIFDFPLPPGLPTGRWAVEGTLLEPELGEMFSQDVKLFDVVP